MQSHCVGVYYKWVCCVGVVQWQTSHDRPCAQLLIKWWCVGDLGRLPALDKCVLLCGSLLLFFMVGCVLLCTLSQQCTVVSERLLHLSPCRKFGFAKAGATLRELADPSVQQVGGPVLWAPLLGRALGHWWHCHCSALADSVFSVRVK